MLKCSKLDIHNKTSNRFKVKRYEEVFTELQSRHHVLIVLENIESKLFKVTDFTLFLYSNHIGTLNLKSNTKESYARMITLFINYIFIDLPNDKSINEISELTFYHGNRFLNDYAHGNIGLKKNKSMDTIEKAKHKIALFYKYLLYKKYIDLKITDGGTVADNFSVLYPHEMLPRKVSYISDSAIGILLRLSQIHYPEITLAIALQAFSGLRTGEVFSISKSKLSSQLDSHGNGSFSIDLRRQVKLREDSISVGFIKKHRIQSVHPIFLSSFQKIYSNHLELFSKENKKSTALFINKRDKAMTRESYYYRFNILKKHLITTLSTSDNYELRAEANVLMNGIFGPHILRYYFTQTIVRSGLIKSSAELATWRGDSSLDSSIRYLSASPLIENEVLRIQDEKYLKIMEGEVDERSQDN